MTSPSEPDSDWWVLIDKKAALKEQFPSLVKVRNERPGCRADVERKRVFREATQLRRVAEQQAAWQRSVAANERRQERADNRHRAAEYRAHQQQRNERRTA